MPIPKVTVKIPTLHKTELHVAHKAYNVGQVDEIRPGDVYQYIVTGGYYINGPRFLHVRHIPVSKGSAWPLENAA